VRIKLDENLSRHLKTALTEVGHEVSTTADENLLGRTDVEVAAAAVSENMMIFTLDVAFADLRRFPPGNHPGIVLFRPGRLGPVTVNRFVLEFVRDQNLESLVGSIVIAEPSRIRIRSVQNPSYDLEVVKLSSTFQLAIRHTQVQQLTHCGKVVTDTAQLSFSNDFNTFEFLHTTGTVHRRQRLVGLLNYYYREAA
jgi:predicted nuclease of predicted toxin-antitoxin system